MLQHGGHEVYTVKKLVEDYSVTTNFMGPSEIGIENIQNHLLSNEFVYIFQLILLTNNYF
jgi:hypothetical protein